MDFTTLEMLHFLTKKGFEVREINVPLTMAYGSTEENNGTTKVSGVYLNGLPFMEPTHNTKDPTYWLRTAFASILKQTLLEL